MAETPFELLLGVRVGSSSACKNAADVLNGRNKDITLRDAAINHVKSCPTCKNDLKLALIGKQAQKNA